MVEIRRSVEEELLESRLAEGEHRAVIADAERLVRESPLRENRWAILAMANYRAGRQAEALSSIRAARARLADDLGIDIGDRLRALESSMLQQDPTLAPPKAVHRVSQTCPYRGLQPFSPSDTEDFFGRDADIEVIPFSACRRDRSRSSSAPPDRANRRSCWPECCRASLRGDASR